jgi:hypothetical protein
MGGGLDVAHPPIALRMMMLASLASLACIVRSSGARGPHDIARFPPLTQKYRKNIGSDDERCYAILAEGDLCTDYTSIPDFYAYSGRPHSGLKALSSFKRLGLVDDDLDAAVLRLTHAPAGRRVHGQKSSTRHDQRADARTDQASQPASPLDLI